MSEHSTDSSHKQQPVASLKERWGFVPGYSAYEVSSLGRVRSYWKCGGHGKVKYIGTDNPVILDCEVRFGRRRVGITDHNHRRRQVGIASLVLTVFRGRKRNHIPGNLDGDRLNDCLDNLVWLTRRQFKATIAAKCSARILIENEDAGLLFCSTCQTWLPKSAYTHKTRFRCGACHNSHKRRWKYGVTSEVVDQAKNGVCEICGRHDARGLHMDHCHESGKFRGLLCPNCNTAIGMLNDDPKLLRKAMLYLVKHREK